MNRFLAACVLAIVWAPAGAWAADFIGSESCRACHVEAYEHWRQGPHARAHLSLTPAQAQDQKCIQCHAPDTQKGGDAGVSCESCHGAGEYYAAEYVMKDAELAQATGLLQPKAADCLLCHDASSPSLQAFDAEKKMKEIDHWTKSRDARKKNKKTAEQGPCELPSRKGIADVIRAAQPKGTFLARVLVAPAEPEAKKTTSPPAAELPASVVVVAQSESTR